MLHKFTEFIQKEQLLTSQKKVLIGVSGGVDSTVLTHLFAQAEIPFAIAHCNFQLRGADAEADEKFVKELAEQYQVPFHVVHFETANYCKNKGISTQMGARELRYNWFDELLVKHDYQSIAVGTHLNDSIETFILNATKGTGLTGLRGILPINGTIIRPLLFADQLLIDNYAISNKLPFQIDKSNASTKYLRNKIRHQIIPLLAEINPNLTQTFANNFAILRDTNNIYKKAIQAIIDKISVQKKDLLFINIPLLQQYPEKKTILFELLQPFGFNSSQVNDLLNSLATGKVFLSTTHQLLINRAEIIVSELQKPTTTAFVLEEIPTIIKQPITLKFDKIENKNILFGKDKNTIFIDADQIKLPLTIRKWKQGDYFIPFGMKGKKKVSDYFINEKIAVLEKNNSWLLTDKENIIWIIGHRADNRCCVSTNSKNVIQVTQIIEN